MVMIPLRSAPFWTPEQRLTDKELLRRLIGFSQRNKHIDNQHLKVALAAQANAHDAKYNSQVQEAAVAGAFYAAMCTPTAAPQPAFAFMTIILSWFSLPFVPFAWAWWLLGTKSLSELFPQITSITLECRPAVSSRSDEADYAETMGLCPLPTPTYWLPAYATVWLRVVFVNMYLNIFLVAKVLIVYPLWFIWQHPQPVTVLFDFLMRLADPTPQRVAFAAFGLWFTSKVMWFSVDSSYAWRSFSRSFSRVRVLNFQAIISILFGLPSSPYRSNAGHGPFTQAWLSMQLLYSFSELSIPYWCTTVGFFSHAAKGEVEPLGSVAMVLLSMMLFEQFLLFWGYRNHSATRRPWHPEDVPETLGEYVPESPPAPPMIIRIPPELPVQLPQVPEQPVAVPVNALPPPAYQLLQNADPFAVYNVMVPDMTFRHFNQVLLNLPVPPLNLFPGFDPAQLCVWDCLGTAFGAPPATVMAVFLASLPPAQRLVYLGGVVPLHLLGNVMAAFPSGYNLWHAHIDPNTGNLSAPVGTTPVSQRPSQLDWPVLSIALSPVGNNCHLTLGVPVLIQCPPVMIPVAADVALTSRRVPVAEAAASMQVPLLWNNAYDRMSGAAPNAAGIIANGVAVQPLPPYVPLPATAVQPQIMQYTLSETDRRMARDLATDLKLAPQLLKARDDDPSRLTKSLAVMAKYSRAPTVEFVLLNGAAGSGKSYFLRSQLPVWAQDGSIRIHTWSAAVRSKIITDFEPLFRRFGIFWEERTACSGATPLFQSSTGTLILDDAALTWPGMIPLILLSSPGLKRIVLTFDSAQSRPPFPEADSLSRSNISSALWLAALSNSYATLNRRLSIEIAALLGLPRAFMPGAQVSHGAFYIVAKPPLGVPLFVASPRYAEAKSKGGLPTYPLGDIQGLSVDGDIAIDLGGLSSGTSDSQMYMALTRGSGSVFLVLPSPGTTTGVLVPESYGCSVIVSAILAVATRQVTPVVLPHHDPERLIARAVQSHLAHSLSPTAAGALGLVGTPTIAGTEFRRTPLGLAEFVPGPLFLHQTPNRSAAYRGKFFGQLPSMGNSSLSPVPGVKHRRERVADALKYVAPVTLETVISAAPREREVLPTLSRAAVVEPDPAIGHHPVTDYLDREVYVSKKGLTQQVMVNGSSLGLHHTRRDHATESLSLRARITPRKARPRHIHRHQSTQLRSGFVKFASWGAGSLDEGLFQVCITEYLSSWLSGRTYAQIVRSVEACEPDWDPTFVKLFLKSQRIKKLEKANSPAVKGQIVTDMSHIKLFRDAVWALYLEKKLMQTRRPGVYLHCRSPFARMVEWYKRYWPKGSVTYTDYTGWDTNVDEGFTLFYASWMRSHGVPTAVVTRYVYERHNSRSFLGPMPAMQFSGDRYTWLLNTVGNMALTGLLFDIKANQVAAFSGDDSILAGDPSFTEPEDLRFGFQPKVTRGFTGEFCGFMFGHDVLHVSPSVLLHRGTMALEDGRRDEDYWRSFGQSLHYAQSGDFYPDLVLSAAVQCYTYALDTYGLSLPPLSFDRPP
jgi:hypothetical protein